MGGAKPFDIPKKEIWEAFKRVRANGGAAGVDGESIAEFEADLTGNLYKLWNRLSSGSYFPPPVRRGCPGAFDARTPHGRMGVPPAPGPPRNEPRGDPEGLIHASGGEKTTRTRRSSVMWWKRCGTPAGT